MKPGLEKDGLYELLKNWKWVLTADIISLR
jgi:hypothetical protein